MMKEYVIVRLKEMMMIKATNFTLVPDDTGGNIALFFAGDEAIAALPRTQAVYVRGSLQTVTLDEASGIVTTEPGNPSEAIKAAAPKEEQSGE